MAKDKVKSTSPKGGKRGCLCDDGKTYSKECCKGELINQGIGNLTDGTDSERTSTAVERVELQEVTADGGNVVSVITQTNEPRVISNSH